MKRAPFEPGREWRTVNAIHRKQLSMREKSLLIAVAKHESRRDRFCHASIRTLAADMGSDVKTARFALHALAQSKIVRVRNIRGSSSRIVVDWKRFAKLPSVTPPESGRGASRRRPLPKLVAVPLPNQGVDTPPESGTTQRVKNQGCGIDSGAARIDSAKHIEGFPSSAVANPVRPSISFKEVAAKKKHPAPPWVKGEVAESLYAGIHDKKIADAFFDARLLNPRDRLAACVTAAVTTLAISRVATLKALSANEIERHSFEELLGGLPTLELVQDFEARRRHTVQAVTRAVIGVCVRMLGKKP